jgi:hypothetical protein
LICDWISDQEIGSKSDGFMGCSVLILAEDLPIGSVPAYKFIGIVCAQHRGAIGIDFRNAATVGIFLSIG